ncbi:MAG: DUF2845 domain-containing protein [Muribaculaceae bacterium]|nr:DUF2845 domain-containing protein [Muribaculaceae bacterium]
MLWSTALLWTVLSASCFTGIESTPKITANDVRKQNIVETKEDHYLDDIIPDPLAVWHTGKLLYVTDSRVSLALIEQDRMKSIPQGSILTFQGVSPAVTVTGKPATDFSLLAPDGTAVTYRAEFSESDLRALPAVEIPFTVDLSLVAKVKDKMATNSYYTVTSAWYDMAGKARKGRKFVPVRVLDVSPGDSHHPFRLTLAEYREGMEADTFSIYMSAGSDKKSTRRFSTLFALDNPRQRYPDITDEHWALIQNGRVTEGMTRTECRLALGKPDNVERQPGYSVLAERWTFENGRFLIFEDGILRQYRL